MTDDDFEIAVVLNRKEIRVILTCLEQIWNCTEDKSFFEGDAAGEEIRTSLVEKFERLRFPDVSES